MANSSFTVSDLAPTAAQLSAIARALTGYMRLPFASTLPGAFVEAVIARVRDATVLATYDFVDVVDFERGIGWQVKSTKSATPVTWKRAKLAGAPELIDASRLSDEGLQALGDSIISFCNEHVESSLQLNDGLRAIGYARAILFESVDAVEIRYFERELVTAEKRQLFDPTEFRWQWSAQKQTVKKEQLSALHGFHRPSERRWFAWHGLGENQLHFTGESAWWPDEGDPSAVLVRLPRDAQKIGFEEFVEWVSKLEDEVERN